jgi:hypothetical protein
LAYNFEKWTDRVRNRTDISGYLSHLTKESGDKKALDILIKILTEKKLIGSSNSGFVAGSSTASCFQDVPIYSLCQNTLHEQMHISAISGH